MAPPISDDELINKKINFNMANLEKLYNKLNGIQADMESPDSANEEGAEQAHFPLGWKQQGIGFSYRCVTCADLQLGALRISSKTKIS
jgi:hypothetical protein